MPASKAPVAACPSAVPTNANRRGARQSEERERQHSPPAKASHENPYFAHIAMCKEGAPTPVQPPLGWVLSKATQEGFGELLKQCGNDHELSQLEIALGKQPQQLNAGQ